MQAEPPRELPHAFDRVEVGTVGRKVVERELDLMLLPPLFVQFGMVEFGVVSNHDNFSTALGSLESKILHEGEECHGVETLILATKDEFAIPEADSPEVTDALSPGMVQQRRILHLRRYPHATS